MLIIKNKKMFKVGKRHNLIYPLMFVIFTDIRLIISIIMKKYIKYYGTIFLTLIMFIADFLSGLIVYLYNLKYLRAKKEYKFMGIELIQAPSKIIPPDNHFKIYFLLFLGSYLDFTGYFLTSYYMPRKYGDYSRTLEKRLKCILICTSSFFCFFTLKFPLFKHQKMAVLIIFVCLVILVGTEILYYHSNSKSFTDFTIIFLIFFDNIFTSSLDVIEKYLLEYDFLNPYKILMIEGIIGFCLTINLIKYNEPFQLLKYLYDNENDKFPYLVACLIMYFLLSCGRNVYRVTTNKLYSPTTKALFDYILVPFLIIFCLG